MVSEIITLNSSSVLNKKFYRHIFLQQKVHIFDRAFQMRVGCVFLFINHLRLIIGRENVWYTSLPEVEFSSSRLYHDAFI